MFDARKIMCNRWASHRTEGQNRGRAKTRTVKGEIEDLRDAGARKVNAVDAHGEEWLSSRRLENRAMKAGPWGTDGISQRR